MTRTLILALLISWPSQFNAAQTAAPRAVEGGDFTLTDHDGRRFELKQLRGKVVLLYFGYTTCTEACPAAFAKVSAVYRQLGAAADGVATLLVSVDPERDTTEKLKAYLGHFRIKGFGLTGSKAEIDRVVAQYGARYEIERADSALGYHINHTTDLYLIDRQGKLRERFRHQAAAAQLAARLREVLDQSDR